MKVYDIYVDIIYSDTSLFRVLLWGWYFTLGLYYQLFTRDETFCLNKPGDISMYM